MLTKSSYRFSLWGLALLAGLSYLACGHRAPEAEAAAALAKTQTLTSDSSIAPLAAGLAALLKAYPEHLASADSNTLYWKDGTAMRYDDGLKGKNALDLLNNPDLEDQFLYPYPKGAAYLPIPRPNDPGRIRYEPFFLKMYGDSKQAVQKNLRTIVWMPKVHNVSLQVTTVNGVDKKLEAISEELQKLDPKFYPYLANPGGTFNWRLIAGTKRMSMHSFGMTIDINVAHSDYWRWAVKDPQEDGTRPIPYKNRIPLEIVAIFEKHGFIWGGKWYHFDTMHFEYRPELLLN